jgi:hypothetical protein
MIKTSNSCHLLKESTWDLETIMSMTGRGLLLAQRKALA